MIDRQTSSAIAERARRNVLHVIVNPVAAAGRTGKHWPEINNALAAHGFGKDLYGMLIEVDSE